MSYKKKFLNKSGVSSPISGGSSNTGAWNGSPGQNGSQTGGWDSNDFGYKNYMSRLPEVYTGHPNRVERYNQYEMMDVDAEINACLDILAEFSTQRNEHNKTPFEIQFKDDPTPHEVELLTKQLQQWCKMNEFDVRMFKIFRNVVKYGDQVFVRDPETFKLFWVDMVKVIKVIVNESEGKKPEQYVLKDININLQNLTVAAKTNTDFAANPATGLGGSGGGTNTPYTVPSMPYNTSGSRFTLGQSESAIDSNHILHLSLTEGLDRFWPFGQSILENIFKVYKQKELLEDAVLIYRVQRAPERRVFKIDVGNMPSHMAMAFVDRVKNEIHQRRIPSLYGGQCFSMDTKVPLLDGRSLSIAEIQTEYETGKENWVYSCDPITGKIVPGIVSWAGVTRTNAQVLELTLDNGEKIICTPDHKFPIKTKGFVEAKNIIPMEDSLFSFNHRSHGINSENKDNNLNDPQYYQVYDHDINEWVYTHRMVGSFLKELNLHNEMVHLDEYKDVSKQTIHHIDFNKHNNNPENLAYMHYKDHLRYHSSHSSLMWQSFTDEQKEENIAKRLRSMANNSPEKKEEIHARMSAASTLAFAKIKADPIKYEKVRTRLLNNIAEQSSKPFPNQSLNFDQTMVDILTNTVSTHNSDLVTTAQLLSANEIFMHQYRELNRIQSGKYSRLVLDIFTIDTLKKLIKYAGFKTWKKFVSIHSCGIRKPALSIKGSPELLKIIVDTVNHNQIYTVGRILLVLRNNTNFMQEFVKANSHIKKMNSSYQFTGNALTTILVHAGYKNWTDFIKKMPMYNHKVVSIRYLDNNIDVGTLTIDADEKYHGYHTFALEQGVFTKNSIVDASYSPLCITLDTIITLTDDRRLSLSELIAEYESGKENYAISVNPNTFAKEPGLISWAGITRKNAEIVAVELDNDKIIRTTPDHKFITIDGSEIEAQHLLPNTQLMSRWASMTWPDGNPIMELERTVKSVTKLEYTEDTGCITVKQNHNFLVQDSVFIKNSMNEDYFFPVTGEGRGSTVDILPGGQNLGEIDDLKYFNNRLARGLRVPSSYLPTGPDDNTTPLNDGRVGSAMIQEFRFNQYCERLQNYICLKLDEEFKLFLRWRGFNIDTGLFSIMFNPPQNFAAYRQSELDVARVNTFASMEAFPYISKRFALERFLGLTEEEIKKNEKMWEEENAEDMSSDPQGSDLRNIGVSTGDFEADGDTADEIDKSEQDPDDMDVAGPVSADTASAQSDMAGAGAGPLGGST